MPPSSRSSRRMAQSGACQSSFRVSVESWLCLPLFCEPTLLVVMFVFQRSRPSWSSHRWLRSRMRPP
jgi:hypothetical protein